MEMFKLPNIDNEKSILKTIRLKLSTFRKLEEYPLKQIYLLIELLMNVFYML